MKAKYLIAQRREYDEQKAAYVAERKGDFGALSAEAARENAALEWPSFEQWVTWDLMSIQAHALIDLAGVFEKCEGGGELHVRRSEV